MLGAIAGDIVGSPYEFDSHKSTSFPLFRPDAIFTDDTVLTVATAHVILSGEPYDVAYHRFGHAFPGRGYGGSFVRWLQDPGRAPYNSWGNGSAMRVSPVGFAFDSVDDVLREAGRSAEVTHDHPEGIKGAQATALAVFLARSGATKVEIRDAIAARFGYDLRRRVEEIRPTYLFDVSCQGSVPEAIVAFLDSTDVESAIRLAVSLGGDSDTQGAIAGGIAQAFYGPLPDAIVREVHARLPADLRSVVDDFERRYPSAART